MYEQYIDSKGKQLLLEQAN